MEHFKNNEILKRASQKKRVEKPQIKIKCGAGSEKWMVDDAAIPFQRGLHLGIMTNKILGVGHAKSDECPHP